MQWCNIKSLLCGTQPLEHLCLKLLESVSEEPIVDDNGLENQLWRPPLENVGNGDGIRRTLDHLVPNKPVPPVLHLQRRPPMQLSGDLGPSIAARRVLADQCAVLVWRPCLARNGRRKLADPSLSALLAGPARDHCGDLVPRICAESANGGAQLVVLLAGPLVLLQMDLRELEKWR